MTFREKLTQERPNLVGEQYDGGCFNCPFAYGYEERKSIEDCRSRTCRECWDREIPEV